MSETVCSICLEENSDQKLRCGHCFHIECINNWLDFNDTCPNCRQSPYPDIFFDDACKPNIVTKEFTARLFLVMMTLPDNCNIKINPEGQIIISRP
jgi:hypothetical protein